MISGYWCGRRDSNPHGITPDGFSYQLLLSPPRDCVCGLDYTFTLACALGAARLVSTPSPPGLGSGLPSDRFPRIYCHKDFLNFASRSNRNSAPIPHLDELTELITRLAIGGLLHASESRGDA
jgi:hypothetical protein